MGLDEWGEHAPSPDREARQLKRSAKRNGLSIRTGTRPDVSSVGEPSPIVATGDATVGTAKPEVTELYSLWFRPHPTKGKRRTWTRLLTGTKAETSAAMLKRISFRETGEWAEPLASVDMNNPQ